ncbi:MAG TPA: o-succinylbenzoate synthase [Gemmatimonadaceae bacterium]|nr:o-succinylbenzoate synthase [Gemmatimonadaceae bacterium]
MIRLASIKLLEIRLPLVAAFQTSAGVVGERRILLLELADVDGAVTWAECVAQSLPNYSADTVDTCWLAISDWIAPVVLGRSFEKPQAVHKALAERIRGHRMAKAAVEMGVWSLVALQRELPLARLLAAESAHARQLGTGSGETVETGVALGIEASPGDLAAAALTAASAGYRRIRLKIDPDRDVQFVEAVRDALGPAAVLAVDANGSYVPKDPQHLRALEKLDTLGLSMIEQPYAHDDFARHAELQRTLSTPLCLDESITSTATLDEMLALGSGRVVNLKPGRVGGFTEAIAIHDQCAELAVPVWCGGMLESGIGRAYNVALASLPNFTLPGDLSPSARYWERDVVMEPWTMDSSGLVRVPLDRSGIGVGVDEGFVNDLTVREKKFGAR